MGELKASFRLPGGNMLHSPGIYQKTQHQGCNGCCTTGQIKIPGEIKQQSKENCGVYITHSQHFPHKLYMVVLLQIAVKYILYCIDHLHHDNKNADGNVFS